MQQLRRMAGWVLAASLSVALVSGVSAQAARRVPLLPAAWAKKLGLTSDQKARVKEADTAYQADRQAAQALSTPKEKRKGLREARNKGEGVLEGILTDEQKKQYAAMQAAAREYRNLGGIGTSLAALELSPEQKSQVQAIAAKYEPDIAKLRASLKESTDKPSVQAQIREQEGKRTEAVRAVLTPDQQAFIALAKKK